MVWHVNFWITFETMSRVAFERSDFMGSSIDGEHVLKIKVINVM